MSINWNSIRPLNGSQQSGFEELCTQLASDERPNDAKFVRKGTPDAGVECYATLADDSEWGWQAKYFTNLSESQWPQLDKSVKRALDKHPKLCRYYLCIPLDFPDARIDGQQSARDKWNNHTKKWMDWASERGMNVEFIYWGSHELIDRLTAPKNAGRVFFWFNIHVFDDTWFTARLEEALKVAGPRYTPEIHVNLPIAADFEAFGRTVRFFDGIKAHAYNVHKKLQNFEHIKYEAADKAAEVSFSKIKLIKLVHKILDELLSINVEPVDELPFKVICKEINLAIHSSEELANKLFEFERKYHDENKSDKDKSHLAYYPNPFQDIRYSLLSLQQVLRNLSGSLENANCLANNNLLILSGDAGTGKTHLLCDIAKNRIKEGSPTVLLMGQRFTNLQEPWTQALQQLDLGTLSAEVFVGALEAAAQVAGCRAFVMIDALNEGKGRDIWPNHLAAFLEHVKRSPWIGVVLSVRSSYEQIVIPDHVQKSAVYLKHQGFTNHEYDATKIFFNYYGLETPSSPLLAPEFSNPLFLKTLCKGLQTRGDRRLPKGFHGITDIFELYLSSINTKIALELDFNQKRKLVSKALDSLIVILVETNERWLLIDRAEETVNKLLPGRDFSLSLYNGLVSEGILVEDVISHHDGTYEDVVSIAYERLADHLIVDSLLNTHLDLHSPEKAFDSGTPLEVLCSSNRVIGLLEALCVQIPERTGKELVEFVPSIKSQYYLKEAFRQSLIWRKIDAFSDTTLKEIDKLLQDCDEWEETLNVLLTLATFPNHRLNAISLDGLLRQQKMADRDSWWSTYLHRAWGTKESVDRLVDWASSINPNDGIDEETVELCSITLAWMLTTSNRFLRDHATKALVNLLTNHLSTVSKLVERFSEVDDPYVTERIYAVAYGTAMRSNNSTEIVKLAMCVYKQVFANNKPPAHILLRDYARGVIERALCLDSNINIDTNLIRPPYHSEWPVIPNEDMIRDLFSKMSAGSYESDDQKWSQNQIRISVMEDDFARYVIGTNSHTSNFLSLRLDGPTWTSPDERLNQLISQFSDDAKKAWDTFNDLHIKLNQIKVDISLSRFRYRLENANTEEMNPLEESCIQSLEEECDESRLNLDTLLTEDQVCQLDEILLKKSNRQEPPYFDLSLIQHYILWRVFDLGWTIERFGDFDDFTIGFNGREASKAERIGKKYQWIAYHEIMAFVADNFQYYEHYIEDGDREYKGPWQIHLRDIDPSFIPTQNQKETVEVTSSRDWWSPKTYNNWDFSREQLDWVSDCDDLPQIENFLSTICPKDSSKWLILHGFFNWKNECSRGYDDLRAEKRNLFYLSTGYLIREEDVKPFMEWAENVDFSGRWAPEPPDMHYMFLGEHAWSPVFNYLHEKYVGNEGWIQPDRGCPVKIQNTSMAYDSGMNGFDCSIDDNYSLKLLSPSLIDGLGLEWTGYESNYVDVSNLLVAFESSQNKENTKGLLVRREKLTEFLAQKKLTLCWIVIGEKLAYDHIPTRAILSISGAYVLNKGDIYGFTKYILEKRTETDDKISPELIKVQRTINREKST